MSYIYLYGPPGTGKSTIGKIIARNLKLPFVDLDRVIETNAGISIPQIMEGQGESAFRDLETVALSAISPPPLGEELGRRAEPVEAVRSFFLKSPCSEDQTVLVVEVGICVFFWAGIKWQGRI